MTPVEILMAEHRVIEQVLNCVEKLAEDAGAGRGLRKQDAADAIEFITRYADGCHHGKEEHQLFPKMESLGMPRDGGPIGVMLYEHEQGRTYVRGMKAALDGAAAGDKTALRNYQENALGYVHLLRSHIMKEDQILFRMADQMMSPEDQAALLKAFEKVEREDMGTGTHERLEKLAEDLRVRLNVPKGCGSGAGAGAGFS